MENATKALLIAAAVIVAILIISLGIGIFTRASEQVDSGDLTEYQAQQFNSKFKKYAGKNVSGSDVNALLSDVYNHNQQQEDSSTRITVTIKDGATTKTVIDASKLSTTSPDTVGTGSKYKVECTYNTSTGLITSIAVEKK